VDLMLLMSLFVLDMNWLTLDDSVSIESRTGMIASAVLSTFLTVEQSEFLLFLLEPTLAIDPRPFERFCRRVSKLESC